MICLLREVGGNFAVFSIIVILIVTVMVFSVLLLHDYRPRSVPREGSVIYVSILYVCNEFAEG